MKLKLTSFKSLGDIQFKMNIPDIEKILGPFTNSFYRNEFSKMPTYSFEAHGIFILVNKDSLCEAIEVSSPSIIIFEGKEIQGNFKTILEDFKKQDMNLEIEDAVGFTSHKFGLSVYSINTVIESVLAFSDGYYT